MSDGFAVNEDYWQRLEDDVDDDVPDTVLDRIVEQLDPDRIHGIEFHGSNGRAYYGVVAYSAEQNGMDVLDLRTVVVDLRDDVVKVHDNGLWIPRFEGAAGALTSIVARASSEIDGSIEQQGAPLTASAINTDADRILGHEIEDDYQPDDGDGWGSTWGNGNGEPPEAHTLVDRLEQADVRTDRFSRLEFGKKTPWERYGERTLDGLLGNYGVETIEGDALVVVDVDYPADAPLGDLPETFRVSSPNGDDDRAHHYYRVPNKEAVAEHFGTPAVKPGWGDVWLSGEYVVGPGCRADGGKYEIVLDVPIATLSSDEMIDLLEDDVDEADEADDRLEEIDAGHPEPEPVDDDAQEDDEPAVECYDCGSDLDPGTARLEDRDGSPAYICPGGECE